MHRHQPISQNNSCRQAFVLLLTHPFLLLQFSQSLEYHKQYSSHNRRTLSFSPLSALPQMFAKFVADKILKLYLNLQSNPSSTPAHLLPSTRPSALYHFTPINLVEISHLLSQSPNSHCNLDPIPTNVLKEIANEITPTILSIVNLRLLTGTFPSSLVPA